MKFISNISEKTGLQENMILGILLIFSSVVLYFIYKKMNNKKENFASTVKELINKKSTRQKIPSALKQYCNTAANNDACIRDFRLGRYGHENCTECFEVCDFSRSGNNQKAWCKIGCNQKYNPSDEDDICPTKIEFI